MSKPATIESKVVPCDGGYRAEAWVSGFRNQPEPIIYYGAPRRESKMMAILDSEKMLETIAKKFGADYKIVVERYSQGES